MEEVPVVNVVNISQQTTQTLTQPHLQTMDNSMNLQAVNSVEQPTQPIVVISQQTKAPEPPQTLTTQLPQEPQSVNPQMNQQALTTEQAMPTEPGPITGPSQTQSQSLPHVRTDRVHQPQEQHHHFCSCMSAQPDPQEQKAHHEHKEQHKELKEQNSQEEEKLDGQEDQLENDNEEIGESDSDSDDEGPTVEDVKIVEDKKTRDRLRMLTTYPRSK